MPILLVRGLDGNPNPKRQPEFHVNAGARWLVHTSRFHVAGLRQAAATPVHVAAFAPETTSLLWHPVPNSQATRSA